jgi:uncharacterized protein YdiU (UPF0061 family)
LIFQNKLAELYRKKLGFVTSHNEDAQLIQGLLDIMESERLDYTNTFRNLSQAVTETKTNELNSDVAMSWIKSYQERHNKESKSIAKKISLMNAINPKYILRNYMAQEVIEAAENSDFLAAETLIEVITSPYDELDQYEHFANRSPDWAKNLEISCSS